jgi:hypothetical protein
MLVRIAYAGDSFIVRGMTMDWIPVVRVYISMYMWVRGRIGLFRGPVIVRSVMTVARKLAIRVECTDSSNNSAMDMRFSGNNITGHMGMERGSTHRRGIMLMHRNRIDIGGGGT